jgi:hypothetical protein
MAKPIRKLGSSSFSQNNTHYDHFIHLEYDDSLLLEFALVMELHFVPIFVRVINTILSLKIIFFFCKSDKYNIN